MLTLVLLSLENICTFLHYHRLTVQHAGGVKIRFLSEEKR